MELSPCPYSIHETRSAWPISAALAMRPLSGSALSFLMSLSLPLGALLIAATLRDRLEKAAQDLADRKVVERAKGLLQARFQWTEEEAYFRVRQLSRRSRTPMRDIAQLVIESSAESLAEVFQRLSKL